MYQPIADQKLINQIRQRVFVTFGSIGFDAVESIVWDIHTNPNAADLWAVSLTVIFKLSHENNQHGRERAQKLHDLVWALPGTKGPWIQQGTRQMDDARVIFNIPKTVIAPPAPPAEPAPAGPMTINDYRNQLRLARDHMMFEYRELHRLARRYLKLASENNWCQFWYDRYTAAREQYQAKSQQIDMLYRFLELTYPAAIDDYITDHTPALTPPPVKWSPCRQF